MTEAWLFDKSALVRLPAHPDEPTWSQRVDQGLVHVCAVTLLEVGYSARNAADHARLLGNTPLSRMIVEWDTPAAVTRRAYEVQMADTRGASAAVFRDMQLAAARMAEEFRKLYVQTASQFAC